MIDQGKIDIIKNGKPFSYLDIIATCLVLALSVGIVVLSLTNRTAGNAVIITQKDTISTYDITVDKEVVLETEDGNYVIVIKDKTVFVKHSPCLGQDCVAVPPIKYTSQFIACPPLKIHIKIQGEGELVAII